MAFVIETFQFLSSSSKASYIEGSYKRYFSYARSAFPSSSHAAAGVTLKWLNYLGQLYESCLQRVCVPVLSVRSIQLSFLHLVGSFKYFSRYAGTFTEKQFSQLTLNWLCLNSLSTDLPHSSKWENSHFLYDLIKTQMVSLIPYSFGSNHSQTPRLCYS